MLKSQRLTMERNNIANEINAMPEVRSDDPKFADKMAEVKASTEKLRKANEAVNAAIEEEARIVDGATFSTLTAEHRERVEVTNRAELAVLVGSVLSQRNVTGAEAEAQAAWGIHGHEIPVAMLASVAEHRVIDAPTNAGTGADPVLAYTFGPSIAQYANIARPAVPSGQHVYPSLSSGAAGTRTAIGTDNADQDPSMRGELLSPIRVQANTSISIVDRAMFADLGPAVARHLGGAVAAGLDAQALNDNNGFFDATNGPLTSPNNPGTATTWAQYAAMVGAGLDGRHALTPADVTLIGNDDVFTDADALYRNNNSNESAAEVLGRRARFIISAAMPATVSNVANILLVRGAQQAAVQPLWPGISIEDVYTNSKTGLVAFTAVALAAFSVQQPSAYQWLKINNS